MYTCFSFSPLGHAVSVLVPFPQSWDSFYPIKKAVPHDPAAGTFRRINGPGYDEVHHAGLVPSDCSKNNTTDWVPYKQQKFTSHSFGGWESKTRVPARSGSGEDPLPVADGCLPAASSHSGRDELALWGLLYKGTDPIHEGTTFLTSSPPKGPTSYYHHLKH